MCKFKSCLCFELTADIKQFSSCYRIYHVHVLNEMFCLNMPCLHMVAKSLGMFSVVARVRFHIVFIKEFLAARTRNKAMEESIDFGPAKTHSAALMVCVELSEARLSKSMTCLLHNFPTVILCPNEIRLPYPFTHSSQLAKVLSADDRRKISGPLIFVLANFEMRKRAMHARVICRMS